MRRVQGLVWLGGATLVSQARVGPKRLTDSQRPTLTHISFPLPLRRRPSLPVYAAFISSVSSVEIQSQILRLLPETSGRDPVTSALLQSQLIDKMWRCPVTPLLSLAPWLRAGNSAPRTTDSPVAASAVTGFTKR